MADDDTMNTEEYVKHLIAHNEPLEGILTVLICEVHNQMPHIESGDHKPVNLSMVRKPPSNIDVAEIAREIEDCIPDPTTGAQLLTLALLNLLGAVEWTK
jgi:hypothetical protein